MPIQKTHLTSLGLAVVLACALPALAQDLQPFVNPQIQAEVLPGTPDIDNRYRIGIDCAPVSEALRVHLRLPDDAGLLVNGVLDDSPAGRAGIKRFDVIVEANGQLVSSVNDLVVAVNQTKDSEMSLAVIHAGEDNLIKLTPEERDEEEIKRLRNGFANRLGQGVWPPALGGQVQDELERAMEQLQQFGPINRGWRRLSPGIMLDQHEFNSSTTNSSVTLPDGTQLNVTIKREGNEPAEIKVERGNESWELSEGDLDKLPEDIRPHVESRLRGGFSFRGFPGTPNGFGLQATPPVRPRPVIPPSSNRRLQDRFDGLELKMQELQDAIKSIQEK